jgi:flagella basal body P-ring formation protein FlgA
MTDPTAASPEVVARTAQRPIAAACTLWLMLAAALLPATVRAAALDPAWAAKAAAMATEAARAAFGGRIPVRVEVIPGRADPRLRLAPCARVDVYWPASQRPWGRTRIGLRCAEGPVAWNITAPLTVRVWAPAVVATLPLSPGMVIEERHLRVAEADWAERDAPVLLSPADILGRTVGTAVPMGAAVRADHLRRRQWFAAGDTVRVHAVGEGFTVAGEGTALTPGIEGQTARVRTESGRVVTGVPSGERVLELRL